MPTYKNAKRGTWYCKFNYRDIYGEVQQKKREGFKTQREAKAYEVEYINKAHASVTMTFNSLVELYMEDCQKRLKPTTLASKTSQLNNMILPYFGNMPLNTIEATTIRKWQNDLLSSENNYKPTYLMTINKQLSAIFNFAVKYYKLPNNPVRLCGSIGKNKADDMMFWTTDEFNTFIEVMDDKLITKVMYNILFYTGMRVGELLALTLNDFDFDNQTININKSFTHLQGKDYILEPKTPKSKRVVTVPPFITEMLQTYVTKLYGYEPHQRLFDISLGMLHHEMRRGCKLTGVKKIRIHDLRHSHASLLIELGFPPLLISERLGHENIQTTLQTYSHLYPNKHNTVADKLQEIGLK